ncbi:MAG TPA: hypothetical protein DDY13_09880 [Cytophagales bacterium]|nr:hypothetical protein [Cytophagales bacterium]
MINFSIENFHRPHRKQVSYIHHLISHMKMAHFDNHPEFFLIKDELAEFSENLLERLKDEEEKLFPYILQMQQLSKLQIEDMGSTMNWLEEDHMLTADSLQKMQQLCGNYKPGKSGFPAMKLMYQELFNLQKDLQFHIYIENNVLFEKVRHFFVNP